jgi:poly(3-hydroxybutyrate) depolymerase
MSYRMACTNADLFASVVAYAGTTYGDDDDCDPNGAVAIAHIHGTDDDTVLYNGGAWWVEYPGAESTVEKWATYLGCDEFSPDDGEDAATADLWHNGNEGGDTQGATDRGFRGFT